MYAKLELINNYLFSTTISGFHNSSEKILAFGTFPKDEGFQFINLSTHLYNVKNDIKCRARQRALLGFTLFFIHNPIKKLNKVHSSNKSYQSNPSIHFASALLFVNSGMCKTKLKIDDCAFFVVCNWSYILFILPQMKQLFVKFFRPTKKS